MEAKAIQANNSIRPHRATQNHYIWRESFFLSDALKTAWVSSDRSVERIASVTLMNILVSIFPIGRHRQQEKIFFQHRLRDEDAPYHFRHVP
jgi:hypothetical protein